MTHQVAAIAGGLRCAPGPVRLRCIESMFKELFTVELPNLFVSHKIRALIYIYMYDVYM